MEKLEKERNTRGRTRNPKRIADLDISPAEGGCMVYDRAKAQVHFLNPTAVLILELCNGDISTDEVVEFVKTAYRLPEPPVDDVREVLKQLKAEGLLL